MRGNPPPAGFGSKTRQSGCTMQYEIQQSLLAVSQRASAYDAGPSGMQCPQSLVRKLPAGTGYRITLSEHSHVGADTERLLAHGKW